LARRGSTGHYKITSIGGEQVRAFIPHPLPPDPSVALSNASQRLLERATLALGRLDSLTFLLPEPNSFLYAAAIAANLMELRYGECVARGRRRGDQSSI
jgi:hypothetical protein